MARRCTFAVLIALGTATAASAQDGPAAVSTTRLIPYSATLPVDSADAVAGARAVTFALFDDAEGGTLLWSETQTVAVDGRGRFSAHLGAQTSLPLEIFRTEQARWLEVTVDGTALARTMLVAVPYALRAADAETLGGTPASDFVRTDANGRRIRPDGTAVDDPLVDGSGVPNQIAKWNGVTTLSSSIVSESFDNRIGILAPDPTGGGVVDSRFTIRHLDGNTALGILNTANQRRFALNITADGSWIMYDGFGGSWHEGVRQRNGNLGLGASTAARLAVVQLGSSGAAGTFSLANPTSQSTALTASTTGTGNALAVSAVDGNAILASSVAGLAGLFLDDVQVTGTLTKGGGAFRIDHPLDPANKYLQHSFVESSDMMNVYNGNVVLDANGEAWVSLPDWFQALNRDFRYQLTALGAPGPNLHIASEIAANKFKIAGGTAGGKVSWQVTGIRHDAWANANRIEIEKEKPEGDRGFYLHPTAFDLPAAMALPSARTGGGSR